MRTPVTIAAVLAALAIGLVVAANGSVAAAPARGQPSLVQADIAVSLSEWDISPRHLAVVAGQTTRFQLANVGERPHQLTIMGHGETWTSDRLTAGSSGEWVTSITTPGLYQIFCPVQDGGHKDAGMVGVLTVVEEGEPAAAPPPVRLGSAATITLVDFLILPPTKIAAAGQPLTLDLVNTGGFNHDFIVVGHGGRFESPAVAPGMSERWEIIFDKAGVYEIFCSRGSGRHKDSGMIGVLEVVAAASSALPPMPGMPGTAL